MSHLQQYFSSLAHSLPSPACSENASGTQSIIGYVALDKSLAQSELLLCPLADGLIILTFQDYARI